MERSRKRDDLNELHASAGRREVLRTHSERQVKGETKIEARHFISSRKSRAKRAVEALRNHRAIENYLLLKQYPSSRSIKGRRKKTGLSPEILEEVLAANQNSGKL